MCGYSPGAAAGVQDYALGLASEEVQEEMVQWWLHQLGQAGGVGGSDGVIGGPRSALVNHRRAACFISEHA